MPWPTLVTVALAAITAALGLYAAYLWREASKGAPPTPTPIDQTEFQIVQMQGELAKAALLNSEAAKWTAWAALAGAATSIWSAIGAYFWR